VRVVAKHDLKERALLGRKALFKVLKLFDGGHNCVDELLSRVAVNSNICSKSKRKLLGGGLLRDV
jgi:hypothetical protein